MLAYVSGSRVLREDTANKKKKKKDRTNTTIKTVKKITHALEAQIYFTGNESIKINSIYNLFPQTRDKGSALGDISLYSELHF